MRKTVDILLWIWQLPQNLLGLLVMLFLRPVEPVRDTGYARVYVSAKISRGISMGCYAFVSPSLRYREDAVLHEGVGHPRQSRMLGPLYLPVVGIPSAVNESRCSISGRDSGNFYTERWADRLAGLL